MALFFSYLILCALMFGSAAGIYLGLRIIKII